MMKMKSNALPIMLFMMFLFQTNAALARSDERIKSEIEANIAANTVLENMQIKVDVAQRQVVLSGSVRLYEQKLVAARIAWTTLGVFEVDNQLEVVPKIPLADVVIEKKIRMIITSDPQFVAAQVEVQVVNGEVVLSGNFVNLHDLSRLKHRVANIEGVVGIKKSSSFVI